MQQASPAANMGSAARTLSCLLTDFGNMLRYALACTSNASCDSYIHTRGATGEQRLHAVHNSVVLVLL